MTADYLPERGDVVWLDFQPQAGHEQTGRRPAVVLSPRSYNGKVGLALLCPITTRLKGYPFEVAVPADCGVKGVVLSDHVKNLGLARPRPGRVYLPPARPHHRRRPGQDLPPLITLRMPKLLSGDGKGPTGVPVA